MDDTERMHQRMLYPATRVRSGTAGGSGTIIYSQPDPQRPEEYITLVLTNHHVIDQSVQVKELWDSVLQRNVKRDVLSEVSVESFDYHHMSRMVSANSHQAEILAYDKEHDLAVLRVLSPKQATHVAELIPEQRIEYLTLFAPVWCCGCSLLHEPFANRGTINGLREIIDNKTYLLQSAHSVFGNSGGALYLEDGYYLLGVPARITALHLGFGVDIMTWMGFAVHPSRLYQFLREQELRFVVDPTDDFHSAMKRRAEKRERERHRLSAAIREDMPEEEAP